MKNWIVFALLFCLSCEAQPQSYKFDTEIQGWYPRTIEINNFTWTSPGFGGTGGCIHVQGKGQVDTWNYALSPAFTITKGKYYRLSGYIKLLQLVQPAPYFKIDIVSPETSRGTSKYDLYNIGPWQKLLLEFQAVSNSTAWLALEKGTLEETTIECWIDEILLEEIQNMLSMITIPPPLEEKRGVHPRLYFTNSTFESLKSTLSNSKYIFWDTIFSVAKSKVNQKPTDYYVDYSDPEENYQWWVSNSIPYLVLVWKLTGNTTYLNSAVDYALKVASYPTWGLYGFNGSYVVAGRNLLCLSLLYDWCYYELNITTKSLIQNILIERAFHMAKEVTVNKIWWSRTYLQSDQATCLIGLGVTALAFFDDPDEYIQNLTRYWLDLTIKMFKTARKYLPPDGSYPGGPGYWGVQADNLIKWYILSSNLLGEDLWTTNEWWQKTAFYRLHMSLPREMWKPKANVVDFGDSLRYGWSGNDYILYGLACVFNFSVAQWLGNEIIRSNTFDIDSQWMSALLFVPGRAEKSPKEAKVETFKHFEDTGIVATRTDWNGNETLLIAKCGPILGHSFTKMITYVLGEDAGSSHVHPDVGHFEIIALNEWQIVDDGYNDKYTAQHNTLVVKLNGTYTGQCGEHNGWLNGEECSYLKELPTIPKTITTSNVDYIKMNPKPAYGSLKSVKITKFLRHILFLKKLDIVLIVDDIETDQSVELSLLFHTENAINSFGGMDNVFQSNGTNSHLRIECLTQTGITFSSGVMNLTSAECYQNTIKMTKTTNKWKNIVAISWASKSVSQPIVTKFDELNLAVFSCSSQRIAVFNNTSEEFVIPNENESSDKSSSIHQFFAIIIIEFDTKITDTDEIKNEIATILGINVNEINVILISSTQIQVIISGQSLSVIQQNANTLIQQINDGAIDTGLLRNAIDAYLRYDNSHSHQISFSLKQSHYNFIMNTLLFVYLYHILLSQY